MFRSFRLITGILTCLLLLNGAMSSSAQSVKVTNPNIVEVYGDFVKELNPEQIAWLNNQLARSEVKKIASKENEAFVLLSSLPLVTKYTGNLKRDEFTEPLKIIPLKYRINFMNKKDQTFRIDGTDYVLFIKGKQ
jgi:hypothetical protein